MSINSINNDNSHSKKNSTMQTIAMNIKPTINVNNLYDNSFIFLQWNSSKITSIYVKPIKLPHTKLKNISSHM